MRSFKDILTFAEDRKGSRTAVLDGIVPPKTADDLAAIPDDRWLAQMARGIMQAGISWQVVENKWPGMEEAFHGFDVDRCAMMSEDWEDELLDDPRIVRSPPKVRAIQHNAAFIREVAAEHGSFGRRIGDWPPSDFGGLLDWLQKEGSRLGGTTGAYMLRMMGKDGYILSPSVIARLQAEGVIDRPPTSKKARAAVQAAFDAWAQESGESLTVISRVLAQSIDA
ncbi:DNA-3-methyladenine glycosylase I [Tropicibacter oceani]|uniref:DNA-3-methyladenine glycosylase I n=1 Tax=Tropicibacter oceani TaxID=3058420 RepID=A0ABY8QM89_9RHOB|nr:DNA-3-methyladenine glycosylase I [Tropicibacter oceani]WGW05749.1 DNA-3-methyladenine glycosylase I [Tropicibacter oceani]